MNWLCCGGAVVILAYFFYRSFWAVIALAPIGVWLHRYMGKEKAARQREELSRQFKDCMLAIVALLEAGYSVENAFLECRQDMVLMYGEEAVISRELLGIRRGLNINVSLEELLIDLGERSGCEDIEQFAQIFALSKRGGGNMAEIIHGCVGRIGKQLELKQEIRMILGAKRMELVIMRVMPFLIVFYVSFGNPGYFEALYHNLTGVLIMTACLAVYVGANVLGEKIFKGIEAELL